ncbi:MAG: tyrosine-type recombinase/integrase [Gemmatimonadetes bacterium]|nr:tyrosine-type recombinase/integrase [Gemmatimonadota bacterium]
MAHKPKTWSKQIAEAGLRARLFRYGDRPTLYYDVFRLDGVRVRKSTKREDRKEAEKFVRSVLRAMAKQGTQAIGQDADLGTVFRLFFELKVPTYRLALQRASQTRRDMFEKAWGAKKRVEDIAQHDVDTFAHRRRSGGVRNGTIEADLRWLSTVFAWAHGYKVNGVRLVPSNPLTGLKRPKEKNTRRPIASHQRFVATMEHVDAVDPEGRLGCMLVIARYTGHRENAICQLRANDFLRTKEEVRAALGALGLDERQADYYPHGGLHWRKESDKMGNDSVTPLAPDARTALDAYLAHNPRLGEVPLFPASKDPSRPIRADLASRWLMRAEELAGLPSLSGGRWHPYRRLWATERRHLPAQDVAEAGGWSGIQALTTIYQHATPDKILEVVEVGA